MLTWEVSVERAFSASAAPRAPTLYQMRVSSSDGRVWTITRRYSSFRRLHMLLMHTDPRFTAGLFFPPRVLFRNRSERVVRERIAQLHSYIRRVCALIVVVSDPEIQALVASFVDDVDLLSRGSTRASSTTPVSQVTRIAMSPFSATTAASAPQVPDALSPGTPHRHFFHDTDTSTPVLELRANLSRLSRELDSIKLLVESRHRDMLDRRRHLALLCSQLRHVADDAATHGEVEYRYPQAAYEPSFIQHQAQRKNPAGVRFAADDSQLANTAVPGAAARLRRAQTSVMHRARSESPSDSQATGARETDKTPKRDFCMNSEDFVTPPPRTPGAFRAGDVPRSDEPSARKVRPSRRTAFADEATPSPLHQPQRLRERAKTMGAGLLYRSGSTPKKEQGKAIVVEVRGRRVPLERSIHLRSGDTVGRLRAKLAALTGLRPASLCLRGEDEDELDDTARVEEGVVFVELVSTLGSTFAS